MARLTRKNIKVFAGSATNTGVFGSLQANNPTTSTDVEQIQSLSAWEEGWDAATETSEELPPLEEFQGVQYVTTYQQAYLMQEGLPEWAATVTYYKGCLVKKVTTTGFQIYNSLTDNNIGNGLSDTANWKLVMDSDDLYALDSTVVHNTGAETVAGVKTFSASPIVPDVTAGDSSGNVANTKFVTTADTNLQNQITSLQTSVNQKANDSAVVKLTGSQTIAGTKTFSSSPVIPTATSSDNSTKAASTAFVKNVLSSSGNGLATISKSANGYCKFTNGLLIQWGIITTNTDNRYSATITFPTAFSNTNYSLNISQYNPNDGEIWATGAVLLYGNKTTTSVKTQSERTTRLQWIAIGY